MNTQVKKSSYVAPTPRSQAHALLMLVLGQKLSLDEAIAKAPLVGEGADTRFAMLLTLTTLQHLGQIDAVVTKFLDKPLPAKRLAVSNALRLGAVQLLLLDTPAHAAVNETVSLVKKGKDAGFAGLVNAVLQKISREKPVLPSALENLPQWLRVRWEQRYGAESVAAMAEVASKRAPLDIHIVAPHPERPSALRPLPKGEVNGGRVEQHSIENSTELCNIEAGFDTSPLGEVDALDEKTNDAVALRASGEGISVDGYIYRFPSNHPPVEQLPGYAEGAFFVQDLAASYPVRLLGDVCEHQVLDVCAAPGGKTMQLIRAGAFVTAIDRSAPRMRVVKENLKRMGMQANTIVADAFAWQPSRMYDAILLDAPCTASGTWRRHPEMVQILSADEITEMAALQRKLLAQVWTWLKPGGRMVYCVCSLEPEEGEAQAAWFAEVTKDARVLPIAAETEIPSAAITGNYLRTTPALMQESGGMDGFFAVCFEKL